ncbi:MAG: WD40 repeat domain-containing serine/threonine-protein kinase [Polyangiaceae bacterium]
MEASAESSWCSNRSLGRDVALKELLPELLDQGEDQDLVRQTLTMRFLREARITGQLEHPNIVPVYELGREPDGRLYYTMRVVRGRTLSSAIRDAKSLSERLALVNHFAGLCQATAYAHSRGVVHRDIKPDNVIIGEFGETFVLDWGLAKIVEEASPNSLRSAATLSHPPVASSGAMRSLKEGTASFRTQLGGIVGTPLYMSPERLLQTTDACQPTADVWSLGVVLHFILTGKLPFAGSTLSELVEAILAASPEDVVTTYPDVPRDLAAIAKRALAREPSERYPTARELVKDIAAYQAGEKVAAYEYGSFELLRRFVRRNRAAVVVAALSALSLSVLLTSSYLRVSAARDNAVAAHRRAVDGEARAKSSLSDVLLQRARTSYEQGDYAASTLLAAGALELVERPDARGLVIAQSNTERLQPSTVPQSGQCSETHWNIALKQLACRDGSTIRFIDRDKNQATVTVPARNASLVSLNRKGWLQMSGNGDVFQLDTTGASHAWNGGPKPGGILVASETGEILVRGDEAGKVQVFDTARATLVTEHDLGLPVTAIAVTSRDERLAIGTYRGEIYTWDYRTAPRPERLGQARATVHALAFPPRGNLLLSGGADRSVLIWDVASRQLSLMPLRAESAISSLAWSVDGAWFAVGSTTTGIDLFDGGRLERTLRVAPKGSGVVELGFASEREVFAVAKDGAPLVYALRESRPAPRFTARGNVLSTAWVDEGKVVVLGGLGDQGLCHLHLGDGLCNDRLPLRLELVRKLAISRTRNLMAVGGTGRHVELWRVTEKVPLGYVQVPTAEIRDLKFVESDGTLLVGGTSPVLVRIDLTSIRIRDTQTVPAPIQAMAPLSRDRVLLALRNGDLVEWSLSSARALRTVRIGPGWVMGVTASESKGTAVAVDADGYAVFVSLAEMHEVGRLRVHSGRPTAIAQSELMGLVATGGEDRTIQLFSSTWPSKILVTLNEHQGTVRSLLFDPNSVRLISSGDDGLVRLWDLTYLSASAAALRAKVETEFGLSLQSGQVVAARSLATVQHQNLVAPTSR